VAKILYTDFPIHRFECTAPPFYRRKGIHRTFSLLPAPLIPYERLDIPAVLAIARLRLSGESLKAVCDRSADMREKEPLLIGTSKIRSLVDMVKEAFNRLPLMSDFVEIFRTMLHSLISVSLLNFIEWAENYHSALFPRLSAPVSLALDYYRKSLPLVIFLFGTPSHQRRRP
jgi:hypothetical protein